MLSRSVARAGAMFITTYLFAHRQCAQRQRLRTYSGVRALLLSTGFIYTSIPQPPRRRIDDAEEDANEGAPAAGYGDGASAAGPTSEAAAPSAEATVDVSDASEPTVEPAPASVSEPLRPPLRLPLCLPMRLMTCRVIQLLLPLRSHHLPTRCT